MFPSEIRNRLPVPVGVCTTEGSAIDQRQEVAAVPTPDDPSLPRSLVGLTQPQTGIVREERLDVLAVAAAIRCDLQPGERKQRGRRVSLVEQLARERGSEHDGAIMAIVPRPGAVGKEQRDEGGIAVSRRHQKRQPAMWVFWLGLARNQDTGDIRICAAIKQQAHGSLMAGTDGVHQGGPASGARIAAIRIGASVEQRSHRGERVRARSIHQRRRAARPKLIGRFAPGQPLANLSGPVPGGRGSQRGRNDATFTGERRGSKHG